MNPGLRTIRFFLSRKEEKRSESMNPGLRTIRFFLSPGRVVPKPLSVNPE